MREPTRTVLVVEDNDVDYELVRRCLPRTLRTIHAPTAAHAFEHVRNTTIDCILLDFRLPDVDGIDLVFEFVKSSIPVIVMTGHGDTHSAVEAMKRGAADYLPKGRIDAETLTRAVELAIERAALQRELAHRDAQLRALAEKLPAIVWTVDSDSLLTTLTGKRRDVLGFDEADAIGRHVEEVFAAISEEAGAGPMLAAAHAAALAGRPSRFELHANARTFEGHVVPLVEGSGRQTGASGLLLDISESRALERQLQQAQKLEALGQFAGGLAHDMNNILAAIVLFTNFVRETATEGSQTAKDLDEVLRASDRGIKLLRQMLVFSRRETLSHKSIDVREALRETLPMLQRLAGEDIRIDVLDHDDGTFVRMDRSELEQIIVNVTVNARDAIKGAGRILFELSCVTLDKPARIAPGQLLDAGEYVVTRVTDTGVGVPAEVLSRVFEPFFTTKERERGTGLGLSTCHGIARRSGGTIALTSEVGRGTTVHIYLPRAHAPVVSTAPSASHSLRRTGSETILYVEDDATVRHATARVLRNLGYTVLEAEDVETALSVERRHAGPIHIVLTDIVIPGGSGRDVVNDVLTRRRDARALYVSGYTPDSLRLRGLFDVQEVLEKPFTLNDLARRVRMALDTPQVGRDHAALPAE